MRAGGACSTCGTATEPSTATLTCPPGEIITAISFASYGLPTGTCDTFAASATCDATTSTSVVEGLCLEQASCSVYADSSKFGDPCSGVTKQLDVRATCGTPASCKAIHALNPSLPDGAYTIDPDGAGSIAPSSVYCDMTYDDGNGAGGWTLIELTDPSAGPSGLSAGT